MSSIAPDQTETSPRPLCGLRAVVTGASSGIGRQIAIEFARAGCAQLLVHYHKNVAAAQTVANETRAVGTETAIDACDFGQSNQIHDFVKRCFDSISPVDLWVHCAGADVLTGEAAAWSFDKKLQRLIEVDLTGSIQTGRLVAERLLQQAQPRADCLPPSMLFIGWDQASQGMEGDAGQLFGPIKAGVAAFARSLAQEVAPQIRVNIIAPGWIRTAWGNETSEYWNQRAQGQSLMNRWGTPGDIAAAAVFLSTPTNSFVTGQTLQLNGGWNRRYGST